MSYLFDVRVLHGWVKDSYGVVREAATETVEIACTEVKQASVMHGDEVGFGRFGKDRRTCWRAGTTWDLGLHAEVRQGLDLPLVESVGTGRGRRGGADSLMKHVQGEIQKWLEAIPDGPGTTKRPGIPPGSAVTAGQAVDLCVHRDRAVPTNSKVERSIWMAVLWRKVSQGVNREEGARFVERMLTLVVPATFTCSIGS